MFVCVCAWVDCIKSRNTSIYVFSNNQATILALKGLYLHFKFNLEMISEPSRTCSVLAIVRTPGHSSIPGNKKADELARMRPTRKFVGRSSVLDTQKLDQTQQFINVSTKNSLAYGGNLNDYKHPSVDCNNT